MLTLRFVRMDKWIAVARGIASGIFFGAVFSAAAAQDPVQEVSAQVTPTKLVLVQQLKVGEATQKLLMLQASGVAASNNQYPMPVAVAEKVYQRYIDSFSHPIPEKTGSTLEKME